MKFAILFGLCLIMILVFGLSIPGLSEAAQAPAPGELAVVESSAQRIVLEVSAPRLKTTQRTINGTTFLEVAAPPWGHTDDYGKPQVPVLGKLIAVPQQAKVSVKLLRDTTHTQTLPYPVLPAPKGHVVPGANP
jgi:hypothetical protein